MIYLFEKWQTLYVQYAKSLQEVCDGIITNEEKKNFKYDFVGG